MTVAYMELVGVLVTNKKRSETYRVDNLYMRRKNNQYGSNATMKGYELTLAERFETIVQCLMRVYAPTTVNVWNRETLQEASFYLQFIRGFRPGLVGLRGNWDRFAQM